MSDTGKEVYRLHMEYLVALAQTMIKRHEPAGSDATVAYVPTVGFGDEETTTLTFGLLKIDVDSALAFYGQLRDSARRELASPKKR
jgi:hypothetical protein